jgi:hypothetical protein
MPLPFNLPSLHRDPSGRSCKVFVTLAATVEDSVVIGVPIAVHEAIAVGVKYSSESRIPLKFRSEAVAMLFSILSNKVNSPGFLPRGCTLDLVRKTISLAS